MADENPGTQEMRRPNDMEGATGQRLDRGTAFQRLGIE
jgi:hypothetical protein